MLKIAIPSYNAEKYIGLCISSIKQQSVEDFEAVCLRVRRPTVQKISDKRHVNALRHVEVHTQVLEERKLIKKLLRGMFVLAVARVHNLDFDLGHRSTASCFTSLRRLACALGMPYA